MGFPGETDADFADTLEIVEKYGITQLHAFPFSAHVDHYSVPAGSFPDQVPNHIAQSRLKILLKAGEKAFEEYASGFVGQGLRVLVEKCTDSPLIKGVRGDLVSEKKFSGWSENYLACDESNFAPLPGQEIVRGRVVSGIYQKVMKKSSSED